MKNFPKAQLLKIQWVGVPVQTSRLRNRWRPLYHRGANWAGLYFAFWHITWRMPWLKDAAYSHGWNDCFNQMADFSKSDA